MNVELFFTRLCRHINHSKLKITMKPNIVLEKSFTFAVRIVRLYQYLCKEYHEFVLSKQLLRSGTSIEANINEAQAAQSKKDFIAKMAIASKEARESIYWIELLIASKYLDEADEHCKSLKNDCEELSKLITSIVKTSQSS